MSKEILGEKLNWEKNPKEYFWWEFSSAKENTELFNFLPELRNKAVLDFGCGLGGKSYFYLKNGAKKVIALDKDREKINQAKKVCPKTQKLIFQASDIEDVPFRGNSFDVIFMNDLVEHLTSPKKAIKEAERLLKKGGELIIDFMPYFHPKGAHLYKVINIYYLHLFLPESLLVKWAKKRIKKNGLSEKVIFPGNYKTKNSKIPGLYKMTVASFEKMVKDSNFTVQRYKLIGFGDLGFLVKIPMVREIFTRRVLCVLKKS